ncbi:prepilin peptidase [Nocardioides coralli]|uniref:prepilin peptidase n=1 Tax=Nocardioides coralli TaxID=2872154 RepID=UPI001CA3BA23|nr:A24 family peptidase [Nocardioides coralli]QZY30501.1 A24 family peptidase [Nocardioides coralli]
MTVLLVLLAGVATAAAGLLVPTLIRALPEPEHDESAEDEDPKPLYVDVASRRGQRWRSALGSGAAGAVIALAVGWDWWLVALLPVVPVCTALAVIDWHTRLLPSRIVLPATAYGVVVGLLGWALSGDHTDVLRAAIGLVVARSFYWVLWFVHSAGMGFGDVRLAALLGFALGHLGWGELAVGLYAGFLVFGIPGLLLAVVRWDRSLLRSAFPFGPFMIIGALIGIVLGPAATAWFSS